jgi:hypothetical protein
LIRALDDKQKSHAYESALFELYRGSLAPETAFDLLVEQAGRRYDLIAYLFYLKDWSHFLPISPERFDTAFEMLGIELKTSKQCSWKNYQGFLRVIRELNDYYFYLVFDARTKKTVRYFHSSQLNPESLQAVVHSATIFDASCD